MTDDPIDLAPLDPDHDPRAADRFVAGVMGQIAAHPDPDPLPVGLVWGLSSMAMPVAAAAIVILGLALRVVAAGPPAPQTVAESIGVPGLFRGALAAAALPPVEERR